MAYLDGKPEGNNSMVRREALHRPPLCGGEELGGMFLGLMSYLAPKG